MDFGHSKMRMNVEGDRLSSLPDDLIHQILSFVDITDAICASVLSSRWRYIWTSMPYLNLSSEDFPTLPKFSKFVTHVLSRRNNLSELYSVKLKFRGKVSQTFVKRILNYAFSHNVQQLNVVCLLENDMEFPLSFFSSQSLKHLSLTMRNFKTCRCFDRHLTSAWELPSLTTLNLCSVTLRDDESDKCISIFSKCANLKNLTLTDVETMGSNGFGIFHPRLSNLTLVFCRFAKVVNVVTPLLENLTISSCSAEHVITAPHLASLIYKDSHPLKLSTDGFHSLEKADICISCPREANAHQIVYLFQHLQSVKFLTLNLEIVEFLSSSMEFLIHQPSPFVNLKSLKIYPEDFYKWEQRPKKVAMSTELKSYLLDSSPGGTLTMVLREEVMAHKLMAELRVLLEKKNTKTNNARMDPGNGKALEESHDPKTKNKSKIGENLAQIKGFWENFGSEIERRKKVVCYIISKLQRIEELMTTLPASNRAKIQPCFSSLCVKVNIVVSKIADCMKIRCDENQNCSNASFHELVTMLEPSS